MSDPMQRPSPPDRYERPTHPTWKAIALVIGVSVGILLLAIISTFS